MLLLQLLWKLFEILYFKGYRAYLALVLYGIALGIYWYGCEYATSHQFFSNSFSILNYELRIFVHKNCFWQLKYYSLHSLLHKKFPIIVSKYWRYTIFNLKLEIEIRFYYKSNIIVKLLTINSIDSLSHCHTHLIPSNAEYYFDAMDIWHSHWFGWFSRLDLCLFYYLGYRWELFLYQQ